MHQDKPSRRASGPRFTSRKSNAIGFAKRQSRKVKVSAGLASLTDVYEYQQGKNRRANVSLSLAREEKIDFNVGEDEDEGGLDKQKNRTPRLIGEDAEDEIIASDDDEEIYSDAAFEESDEERYAGFDFTKKKSSAGRRNSRNKASALKKKVGFADVDLNETFELPDDDEEEISNGGENDDDEEEGDPDEFIDVLDVLDGKGLPDAEDDDENAARQETNNNDPFSARTADNDEDEDEDSEESNEDEEDEEATDEENIDPFAVSENEGEDEIVEDSALDQLDNFISNLDTGTKRKADDANVIQSERPPPIKKRKRINELTEGGPESEFGVKASDSTKLSLDDLLQPLASQSNTLTSLKKSVKVLAPTSTKNRPLDAPLPQRTQERLDREAAYEQTKGEVDKWNDTMKRIKEAEHLSFPLQPRTNGNTSNLELAAKFKPTTDLENSVHRLLKAAKLREEDITATEDLKMNHLSVEEVAERRAELRKMRELMYRSELKAKRVAKIKSKTYRRIRRKEVEKLNASAAADANDEDDEEARLRRETERARERATLRHKNTGKWAKAMQARGELDEDQRRDINEMLDQSERLRRKIHGEASEDDSESEDESEAEGGISAIKSSAFDELSRLRDGDPDLESSNSNKQPGRSIFDIKFMKAAAERQQQEVNQIMDDFEKEIGAVANEENGEILERDEGQSNPADNAVNMTVIRTGGRMVYHPGDRPMPQNRIDISQHSQLSDDASTLKSSEPYLPSSVDVPDVVQETPNSKTGASQVPSKEPNPWLLTDLSSSKVARKKNEVLVSKNSKAAERSGHIFDKQKQKTAESRAKALDDAELEVSVDAILTLEKDGAKKKQKKSRSAKRVSNTSGQRVSDDSDENSELEEQEQALTKGSKAFKQRELIARAFANDNVVKEFEDTKRREVASDAPREVDTTLPGWGAWGGSGTKKTPTKAHLIKKIPGIDPAARADFKKAHVIISEKKDRKAAKYMVKDLPYPYTSKAQFEQSMDTPLGTEWNTRVGFQRGTLPKVVKKMGTVIDPVQRLF